MLGIGALLVLKGNLVELFCQLCCLQLLLREFDLHVLVLSGHLSVHMMHRVQLLLKEETQLHLFLMLLEVLLVLLQDLVSALLFLLLGTRKLLTLLSKISGLRLVLRLTKLQSLDLALVALHKLVNLCLMLLLNYNEYPAISGSSSLR